MSSQRNIERPSGGVNITGNIGPHTNIAGGDIHVHQTPRYGLDAKRTRILNLGVRRQHLLGAGAIVAATGFVGSLASLYSVVYGTLPSFVGEYLASPITVLFLTVGGVIALCGFYFTRNVELRLPFLGSIEADESGRLYLTDLLADCPFCSGKMRLYPRAKHEPSPVFVCHRSSGLHRLHFDMASMPDVGVEFESRQSKK